MYEFFLLLSLTVVFTLPFCRMKFPGEWQVSLTIYGGLDELMAFMTLKSPVLKKPFFNFTFLIFFVCIYYLVSLITCHV